MQENLKKLGIVVLLSAQQECTWFCSDLIQCGEAYKEYDANTQWLKKSKADEYMTMANFC